MRKEEERGRALGISGVPFYILNQQVAFSGAQPPATFLEAICRVSGHTDDFEEQRMYRLGRRLRTEWLGGATMSPEKKQTSHAGHRRFPWWTLLRRETDELPTLLTDSTGRTRRASVPPGMLCAEHWKKQTDIARSLLPPQFRELLEATEEPFAQPISDLAVPQMASGTMASVWGPNRSFLNPQIVEALVPRAFERQAVGTTASTAARGPATRFRVSGLQSASICLDCSTNPVGLRRSTQ